MPTDKQDGQRVDDTAGNAALHDDVALASWAGIALWVSECRHQVLFHSPHLQARRGSPTRRVGVRRTIGAGYTWLKRSSAGG
jgi:hypothetical protein